MNIPSMEVTIKYAFCIRWEKNRIFYEKLWKIHSFFIRCIQREEKDEEKTGTTEFAGRLFVR